MNDQMEIGPDEVAALLDEIGVEELDGDRDWNYQIWIPEYAESVLGGEIFESLQARFAAMPGMERLAWEDREVFLARVDPGVGPETLQQRVLAVLRSAITDAGHLVP